MKIHAHQRLYTQNAASYGLRNLILFAFEMAMSISSSIVSADTFNPPGDPGNPINIIVFPQRDFISASGYTADDRVVVRVIHNPATFAAPLPPNNGGTTDDGIPNSWISPTDPPAIGAPLDPALGIVEVNHPGGACWFGQTPDIRPGDTVEVEIMANASDNTRVGRIDQTIVQNITAKRPVQTGPGTVVIHGTAQDITQPPGTPLPIGLLEHRLVAPGQSFAANDRRTLRATSAAGAEGTLAYDAPGSINWTATYSGLSDADVTTALGAESRGMWLGNATAPAVETTVYEIGGAIAPGPGAPCSAALEILPPSAGSELIPPSAPTNLTANVDNSNTVTLTWNASSDNVGVTAYGIYRNGANIFTLSKPDGSVYDPDVTPQITFIDRNTPPGTYTYQVKAFDEAGNGSDFSNISAEITAEHRIDPGTFESLPQFHAVPELPINIIAFPSRDFISPSGYEADDTVTVEILRKGPDGSNIVVSSANGIRPDEESFAEVNHPGGSCWEGVTPEIRAGDIVRTIAYNPASVTDSNPDGIRSIDQTVVAGVTAFKPVIVQDDPGNVNAGIVEVHGTALGADGNPLPIGQIEQRMIARRDHFDFNGRRAMRAGAGADGTLTYDTVNNPMGIKWTARYTGLDADDVKRMAGGTSLSTGTVFPDADTRIHWLGHDPVALNEATIFENAPDGNPPGPAGPGCTRPLEAADVTAPSKPGGNSGTVGLNLSGNCADLSWGSSTDDWYVAGYRIYDNGVAVANVDALTHSIRLNNIVPGPHTFSVRAFDTASPLGPGANIIAQISSGLGELYGNLSDAATSGSETD